jgi:hypothetical protein
MTWAFTILNLFGPFVTQILRRFSLETVDEELVDIRFRR